MAREVTVESSPAARMVAARFFSDSGSGPGKEWDMSQMDIAWNTGWNRGNSHSNGRLARASAKRPSGLAGRIAAALVAMVAAIACGAPSAQAALIAGWNLNTLDPASGPFVQPSTGVGTLNCGGLGIGLNVMQGTTLGAQPGEAAGNALAVVGNLFNQSSFQIEIESAGMQDLAVSFAVRRSTTGFANNRLEYWAGLGWGTVATFGASTTAWELQTYSLAALNAGSNGYLTLRFVLDGATGSTGSIRFDNIAVNGSPVPAPAGALALLGLAGCVARRRRS